MSNSTKFNNSINRAILQAINAVNNGKSLPYKCAMNADISDCGLIHITAFKTNKKTGGEYAEYYLPGTSTSGYRYLDEIPEMAEHCQSQVIEEERYIPSGCQDDYYTPQLYCRQRPVYDSEENSSDFDDADNACDDDGACEEPDLFVPTQQYGEVY
jgi:hypothetical protein